MIFKKTIKSLLPLFLSLSLLTGCAQLESSAGNTSGSVVHVVLCWLKDPGNKEHRQIVIDTSRSLNIIPGVKSITVGTPVISERAIVDDSFDIAVSLTFDSIEEMQAYVQDPRHIAAVTTVLNPLVEKLLVYDYIDSH